MSIWKSLSEEEKADFRKWAMLNYKAGEPIDELWHPVIKEECERINSVKWRRIAREYFATPNTMGTFQRNLCSIIQIADSDNLERLRRGFPELVAFIKGERSFLTYED